MPVNATAGQLGLNLGLGRQKAIERRAQELMEQGLGPQEALKQARVELSGRSLGLPLGAEGAAVDLEGLRTGEVAAGDTEDEDFVFGKEFPALSRDLPRPGAEVPSPITYDDDSSLADQDRVAAKAVTAPPAAPGGGPTGGITLPPEPEVGGRPETVARILEVLGGIGAGIGESRSIGKANKLTAQRQALSNLVNTLRGSATAGVAREEPRGGLLQTLGEGLGAGAKSFREGRKLGRDERLARQKVERDIAQQTIENERAAAQAARDERRVIVQEGKVTGTSVPPKVVRPGERLVGFDVKVLYEAPAAPIDPVKEIFKSVKGAKGEDIILRWESGKGPGEEGTWVENYTGKAQLKPPPTTIVLELAEMDVVDATIRQLQDQFLGTKNAEGERDPETKAFFTGRIGTLFHTVLNVDFDPESGWINRLARVYAPISAQLMDNLEVGSLRFAAMLNRGRPSDADLLKGKRLLPFSSDSDELAEAKLQAIMDLSRIKRMAIRMNYTGNWSDLVEFAPDGTPIVNAIAIRDRIASGEVEAREEADDQGVPVKGASIDHLSGDV